MRMRTNNSGFSMRPGMSSANLMHAVLFSLSLLYKTVECILFSLLIQVMIRERVLWNLCSAPWDPLSIDILSIVVDLGG